MTSSEDMSLNGSRRASGVFGRPSGRRPGPSFRLALPALKDAGASNLIGCKRDAQHNWRLAKVEAVRLTAPSAPRANVLEGAVLPGHLLEAQKLAVLPFAVDQSRRRLIGSRDDVLRLSLLFRASRTEVDTAIVSRHQELVVGKLRHQHAPSRSRIRRGRRAAARQT